MRPDNINSLTSNPGSSETSRQSQVRAWAIVGLLSLIFALAMTDRVLLAVMIQPIKADLHLSDSAIGLAQGAAVAVFYLLFALPFGWASDRYDRRVILFCGITIWSLASAGCSLVTSFSGLFLARCLVGAGEAVLGPSGYPLIASLLPVRRIAVAMTVFYLGGTFGIALGQYVGGALLAWLATAGHLEVWPVGVLAPWRIIFLLTGIPGLILASFVFLAPRAELRIELPQSAKPQSGAFRVYLAAHRRFYLTHNLGFGLQQAALTGAMLWNSAFMTRTYGWSPAQIGTVFAAILLATSTAAVVGHSWIAARLFARGYRDAHFRWQLITAALAVPALLFAYLWPTPLAACIGFGLANFLNGGSAVVAPTVLQLATPQAFRGRVSAVYVVIATLIGTAIGPAAIGFVTDHILGDERRVGIAIAACCTLFCLGAVLALALGLSACREIIPDKNPDEQVPR